jgi:endonuclease YncB( thermonuclease family)
LALAAVDDVDDLPFTLRLAFKASIMSVRVRLALVNTPERGQNGYFEAIDFVQSICGVGTTSLVDEDDGQKEGNFDRVIGLVYCGDNNINNKKSLNELLFESGYAVIYQDFCALANFLPRVGLKVAVANTAKTKEQTI